MSSVLAKRSREEDDLSPFGYGYKKSRVDQNPNAISTSFPSARFPFSNPTLSPPLQPTEPSTEIGSNITFEDILPEPFLQWREEKKQPSHSSLQARRPPTLTLDTAMDVDMVPPSPLPNGDNLSPWPLSVRTKAVSNHLQPSPIPHHLINQSLTISGGRTSTPIYSHFTLNMNTELMSVPSADITSAAPALPLQNTNESNWWRRRRLPSPISEAGDILSEAEPTNNISKEAGDQNDFPDSPSSMDVDGDDPPSNIFLRVPGQKLGFPTHIPSAETETNGIPASTAIAEPMSKRAPVTAPRREKISFSMGYRADCEKCQMKVPGHYSHIVRS
ncbi:conserved hypothetical protein [Talaromyces stipitatus ATCC 10500]|uniref:Uncharacterized protein n=1 Tax=Talaromyces stipitatus (strain ATCC 10500 / CBS 375.48 / QM 6759 / NRRL 1006) TaxID=441959 RepID=B8LZB8_TALSN|nr:uncharacterized protein TSTA_089070 [Talaromyces stipitatus ATCC 10500]EED21671.1 conserved hypothetical protein [Talaromyces stipitatus ATCC 10500]